MYFHQICLMQSTNLYLVNNNDSNEKFEKSGKQICVLFQKRVISISVFFQKGLDP